MKLQSIRLRHCYHFKNLSIDFDYADKPITLILGRQSSGKTAILKNIYQALTWFAARYKDLRTAGVVMPDADIMQQHVQSKIEITVRFSPEIGSLSESQNHQNKDVNLCHWQLYKTLNANGIGHSKVETQQLEQLIQLYHKAMQQDPLQGLPMIAYYPTDRFINEMNLISKNNPAVFQTHSAYELVALPYTTFARFFEWFREISDIENAQTAQLLQHALKENRKADINASEIQQIEKVLFSQQHMNSPNLMALKTALKTVFPALSNIYLEYTPKLQLMVTYHHQNIPFCQLSNSIRHWIALVGDVVRRLSLLNPHSLYPCYEGDGILLIDNIDAQLDQDMQENILERLHQAFPQIQIIASGHNENLLEYAEDYQYLKLENQNISEISISDFKGSYDDIYQDLLSSDADASSEILNDPENSENLVQNMYEKFQSMNDQQQVELIRLIWGNDQISSEKI